jgi:hypothetical protein
MEVFGTTTATSISSHFYINFSLGAMAPVRAMDMSAEASEPIATPSTRKFHAMR